MNIIKNLKYNKQNNLKIKPNCLFPEMQVLLPTQKTKEKKKAEEDGLITFVSIIPNLCKACPALR